MLQNYCCTRSKFNSCLLFTGKKLAVWLRQFSMTGNQGKGSGCLLKVKLAALKWLGMATSPLIPYTTLNSAVRNPLVDCLGLCAVVGNWDPDKTKLSLNMKIEMNLMFGCTGLDPNTFFTERKFYLISTKCKKLNVYFSSVLDTLWKSDTAKEKEIKTYHHGAREMEAGAKLLQLRWQIGSLSKSSWVLIIALLSVIIFKKFVKILN